MKPIIAAKAKENLSTGGAVHQPLENSTNPENTRKILAKKAGVSDNTIAKTEKILEHATEETKAKLRTGEISINKAHADTM